MSVRVRRRRVSVRVRRRRVRVRRRRASVRVRRRVRGKHVTHEQQQQRQSRGPCGG